jgi:hypothetical protein
MMSHCLLLAQTSVAGCEAFLLPDLWRALYERTWIVNPAERKSLQTRREPLILI